MFKNRTSGVIVQLVGEEKRLGWGMTPILLTVNCEVVPVKGKDILPLAAMLRRSFSCS